MRDFIIVHQKSSPNLEIVIMTNAISYVEENKNGNANIGLLSVAPSYRMTTGEVCETVETYKEVKEKLKVALGFETYYSEARGVINEKV